MSPALLSPLQVSQRLGSDKPPVLLDVREQDELEIVRIPGALHLPLSRLAAELSSLDPHAEYVVVCHHGVRSGEAAAFMSEHGFLRVANLLGGIDAWACEVDPSMPRY